MTNSKEIESRTSRAGLGCMSVIGIVFVALKLTGTGPVAGWSWWWVFSPFWLPVALGFTIIVLAAVGFAVFNAVRGRARKKDA